MGPSRSHSRNHSWNYSNADAFTDEMYSNFNFYDNDPNGATVHPPYATLPRGGYRVSKTAKRRSTISKPTTKTASRLSTSFLLDSPADETSTPDYDFPSVERKASQPTNLDIPASNHNRMKSADYYWLMNPSACRTASPASPSGSFPPLSPTDTIFPAFQHTPPFQPSSHHHSRNPSYSHNLPDSSITFTCTPTKDSIRLARHRRNLTNPTTDMTPSSVNPLPYIQSNCQNATNALFSHRRLHNCDCDFAYLDSRDRDTGNCLRRAKDSGLLELGYGPKHPCTRRWYTGFFVRQHMKFHDMYCACGCFGQKEEGTGGGLGVGKAVGSLRSGSFRMGKAGGSLRSFRMGGGLGSLRLKRKNNNNNKGSLRVAKSRG